jgi:hypothetical protein
MMINKINHKLITNKLNYKQSNSNSISHKIKRILKLYNKTQHLSLNNNQIKHNNNNNQLLISNHLH